LLKTRYICDITLPHRAAAASQTDLGMAQKAHRGRIQAQGGGVEASKDILYASFLESAKAYNLAEGYWQRMTRQVAEEAGLAFHRFYRNRYANGEKMYEGNPIFNAYFPERHKLVRIIQYLPEPGDLPISAWLSSWPATAAPVGSARPERQGAPIPELTISLALTRETAAIARRLLRQWIVEDGSPEEMEGEVKG
jgi:hypothetical protein